MNDGTAAQNIQNLILSSDSYCLITNNKYKLTLCRIDLLGNLVWAREVGKDSMRNMPVSLAVLNNDDVIVGFNWDDGAFGSMGDNCIMKFDQSGNNLFVKRYTDFVPNSRCQLVQIIKDDSGFTAIFKASTSQADTRIIKMDASGNRINSISVAALAYFKIMKSSANFYYIYNLGLGSILKLGPAFNFLAGQYFTNGTFADEFPDLIELKDSTLLMASGSFFGDCYLDKFDKDLNAIWRGSYGSSFGAPNSLAQLDNNTVVALTSQETWNGDRHGLLTIDNNGVLKKAGIFNYEKIPTNNLCIQTDTKSGKFYFMNFEVLPPDQYADYFNIYCTDTSFGNLCNFIDTAISYTIDPPDFQDPISLTMTITLDSLINSTMAVYNDNMIFGECSDSTLSYVPTFENEITVLVYPNPVTYELNVKTNDERLKEFTLRDFTSKEILQEKFTNSLAVNMDKIAPGIYFYEVCDKGRALKKGKILKY